MQELIGKVVQWAHDRNIVFGSNYSKQLDKTSEEFNELQRALGGYKAAAEADNDDLLDKYYDEVLDAFGDILVTLVIAAEQLGISLEAALASAYDVIKDRKGKLINGKFVKEEDL